MSKVIWKIFWYYTMEEELDSLPGDCAIIRRKENSIIVVSDRELKYNELIKYKMDYHDRIQVRILDDYELSMAGRDAYSNKYDRPKVFYIKGE